MFNKIFSLITRSMEQMGEIVPMGKNREACRNGLGLLKGRIQQRK